MTDDGGFPDPGQMTTSVTAGPAGRVTPQVVPRADADVVRTDDWPDPGQDAARAGKERGDPGRSGDGPAT